MTREEAIANLNMISVAFVEPVTEEQRKLIDDTFEMALKALEQEPCEDAISRQAVLDGLASIAKTKAKSDAQKSLIGRVMFFVEQLPSVNPTKTGHREYNDIYDHYLCGNCKTVVMDYDNYCPNCGCRMIKSQERSDKE